MALSDIGVLTVAALAVMAMGQRQAREWLMLAVSILLIYWLQPLMPIHYMDFWLPTLTLVFCAVSWVLITPRENRIWKDNWPAFALLGGLVLLVGLTRYVSLSGVITASRPPQTQQIAVGLLGVAGLIALLWRWVDSQKWLAAATLLMLGLLFALKFEPLSMQISTGLRMLMQQSTESSGSATYIRWLGFSYVAFRLVHTLRDAQLGRRTPVVLREYLIYVLFFPAFTAGPIDRLERFIKDLRLPFVISSDRLGLAGRRLAIGLFKKFVLADSLALVALGPQNAVQVQSAGWMWVLVYAYAFQLYFDFGGYSDMAIGLGLLMGVKLPENFNRPYLMPNLTQFWNNWHITLTQWIRAYFFSPFSRYMLKSWKQLTSPVIMMLAQTGTMLLIGLWHGVTWNFLVWGLWHGIGLFIQNRWTEWSKPRLKAANVSPIPLRFMRIAGIFLTFHYVVLGWVWFALPDITLSLNVMKKLLGIG